MDKVEEPARRLKDMMKSQLNAVMEEAIDSTLSVLPFRQQLVCKTAAVAAKAKSQKGQRYDAKWLTTCLLPHISSLKAYSLIADVQLLPLHQRFAFAR